VHGEARRSGPHAGTSRELALLVVGIAVPLPVGLACTLLASSTERRLMPAAFITGTTPRSMSRSQAGAWLARRVRELARSEHVQKVSVRELEPSGREPVWLVHIVLGGGKSGDWERLLSGLWGDLRRLGMRPTVVIDERQPAAEIVAA
jgi:hypothetical protein